MINKIQVKNSEAGERIDAFLAKTFPEYSRNYLVKLIKEVKVTVDNVCIKPSYIIKDKDLVEIEFTNTIANKEGIIPQEIDLNIIYEDQNVIVINKQPGLVVHPGSGVHEGTLVNALVNHFPQITDAVFEQGNDISKLRPGLVHRLDKDTSGVIIVAKNPRAMHSLARQIQNRTIKKIYIALCYGWPKNPEGHLVNYLGRNSADRKKISEVGEEKGKIAISDYIVLDYLQTKDGKKASLIEFNIKTGRTHQIRVQSKILGNPVLGDTTYGTKESNALSKKLDINRQMLHAKKLEITLPGNNKASLFEANPPDDYKSALAKLSQID